MEDRRLRGVIHVTVFVSSALIWGCSQAPPIPVAAQGAPASQPFATPNSTPNPTPTPTPITVAAAGDISCGATTFPATNCKAMETSDLLQSGGYDVVLTLGDNANGGGSFGEFLNFFAPTWGRVKEKIRPTAGNHDYDTKFASGYYDYFNGINVTMGIAGDRNKGYYSFDFGGWHFVALNSNCNRVDCNAEAAWLREDLTSNFRPCTLAYFHHPLFTSFTTPGSIGESAVTPFWQALYDHDAEMVLNGHIHNYQRFAPQTPEGIRDDVRGIRQFIVGTGGYSLYSFKPGYPPAENTELRDNTSYGVLALTLFRDRYDWKFQPIAGRSFTDSGSAMCH
jgi:hypothetical protein